MDTGVKVRKIAGKTIIYLFLAVVVVITIFPILYAFMGSFKSNAEASLGGTFFPQQWVFTNYYEAMQRFNFFRYTLNSLYVAFFTTVGSIFVASSAGYCIARRDFPGKKLLMALYLSTMFVSVGALTMRPLYEMMVDVGLHNSLWGVILIQIGAQGTNVFLVSKFVQGVPKEMDEAAVIDGCSFFRIYWQIIIPSIIPVLGVVGLFSFRGSWNDYVLPSIFTMAKPELRTLTVGVVSLKYTSDAAAEWNIMLTGASISILPMLIVYIFTNKTFIQGLTVGAVKG